MLDISGEADSENKGPCRSFSQVLGLPCSKPQNHTRSDSEQHCTPCGPKEPPFRVMFNRVLCKGLGCGSYMAGWFFSSLRGSSFPGDCRQRLKGTAKAAGKGAPAVDHYAADLRIGPGPASALEWVRVKESQG